MSAPAFTPGPWSVECKFAGGKLTGADAEIAEANECEAFGYAQYSINCGEPSGEFRRNPETKEWDVPVLRQITEVVFDPRQGNSEREIANAHLIAAAPELYEALEECAHWVGWCIDEHDAPDSSQEKAALRKAVAALAKARGEA